MFGPILLGAGIGKVTANNGTKDITISELPFALALFQIGYVYNVDQKQFIFSPTGDKANATLYEESNGDYTLTYTGGNDLVTDDEIHIQVWPYPLGYDVNQNTQKQNRENPDWDHYTDSQELVSAADIGDTDATYKDQGGEIDVRTYNILGVYLNFTANESTTNKLKALLKHESGGSDEYIMETEADYIKTIGDVSVKIYYEFQVQAVAYVQLQTQAASIDSSSGSTVGTVTIDYILKY